MPTSRRLPTRPTSSARPVLGLVLPVGLAIAWEIAVRIGLSDGRLVPPPSRIYQEFAELAATGELQRHFIATVLRVVVEPGAAAPFAALLSGRYKPDPGSRGDLSALVQKLPEHIGSRVVVMAQAAASAPGSATFAATGTASSTFGDGGAEAGVQVELARIDDLVASLGGPVPTFLKMDIEGAELDALAGATALIRDHGPMLALCVYHRQDHTHVQATVQRIFDDLLRKGSDLDGATDYLAGMTDRFALAYEVT